MNQLVLLFCCCGISPVVRGVMGPASGQEVASHEILLLPDPGFIDVHVVDSQTGVPVIGAEVVSLRGAGYESASELPLSPELASICANCSPSVATDEKGIARVPR